MFLLIFLFNISSNSFKLLFILELFDVSLLSNFWIKILIEVTEFECFYLYFLFLFYLLHNFPLNYQNLLLIHLYFLFSSVNLFDIKASSILIKK